MCQVCKAIAKNAKIVTVTAKSVRCNLTAKRRVKKEVMRMAYRNNKPNQVPLEYAGRAKACVRCLWQRATTCESQDGCNFVARGQGRVKDNPQSKALLKAEIILHVLQYDQPNRNGHKDLNESIHAIEKLMEIEEGR